MRTTTEKENENKQLRLKEKYKPRKILEKIEKRRLNGK